PPEPNIVTLTFPSRMYCHSSAVGCQCNSRSAPGSRSRIAPVMVLEIGKVVESTSHSLPPWLFTLGGLDRSGDLGVRGGGVHPASGAAGFWGGSAPLAKYTSSLGKPSKVDSGRPKFFASSALGVWPIQSLMLNVPNSEKEPLSKISTK